MRFLVKASVIFLASILRVSFQAIECRGGAGLSMLENPLDRKHDRITVEIKIGDI